VTGVLGAPLSPRKHQILGEACTLIARDGYAAFTMRAVARASGLKLGALQYHYRTRDALLRALAAFIAHEYHEGFDAFRVDSAKSSRGLHALLDYMAVESISASLQAHRLFPQLWAMAMVEPVMQELLDEIYATYLAFIEDSLRILGVAEPRGDALLLMSMLEGLTLFVEPQRRWAADSDAVLEALHTLIEVRYGMQAGSA